MGRNWAITIGINGYRNLQKLGYAKQDAESVRDYFSQDLCFEQIYHFSDDSPPIPQDFGPEIDSYPTYTTLRGFLRKRFEQACLRAGDNLWFFFAGHGVRHENRDYLMPIDGDRGDIENTAIPLYYVTEKLRRCGADNVILLVDACRSESGRRDGVGIGEEKQQGVITLFSCSPRESSYEIDELQQGAFTHALLESLRIQGEGNCATVERLHQRLLYRVPQLSQQYQKPRQTPYGVVEPFTKNHLILLPQQANSTDITTLKNDAYRAESEQELAQAKQLWIRVWAVVSSEDPEAIKAIERLARVPVTRTSLRINRNQFLKWAGFGSAGLITAVVGREIFQSSGPSPKPISQQNFKFDVVTVNERGVEINRRPGQAKFFTEDLGNGVTLEMVSIPAGSFKMGSPPEEKNRQGDEGPQQNVNVPAFFMGRFEVTQAQYQQVMGKNPSNFKGDKRPVNGVSWNDAVEFCKKLSQNKGRTYRLPSEAEWEYACRAGTITPFHFGETITGKLANYNASGKAYASETPEGYRNETTPVGSFQVANAFGLYDMHGNVREWCADTWHDNYEGAPTDGSAWTSGGVVMIAVLHCAAVPGSLGLRTADRLIATARTGGATTPRITWAFALSATLAGLNSP